MATWKINTDQFENRRESIQFFPPKKEESKGWNEIVTMLAPNPICVHDHFMPIFPELTYTDREGNVKARDREVVFTCLGSPRTPLGDEMQEPTYDPAGLELCKSIKLPDGSALHDCSFNHPNSRYPARHPWQLVIPVYVHPTNQHEGQFRVIKQYIETGWIRGLIQEVSAHDDDPRSYSINFRAIFQGAKRIIAPLRTVTPGPVPITMTNGVLGIAPNTTEQQQEDFERMQKYCNPFRTPESLVQYLGIEKWNPQYASASAPPVVASATPAAEAPTTADGGDWWSKDDPFSDGSAPAGSASRL